MEIVMHHPSEGVFCWGGPNNGAIVYLSKWRKFYRFPVKNRVHYPIRNITPIDERFGTVRYDMEKIMAPWGEEWPVLIYPENKETQLRQLIACCNWLIWLIETYAFA